MEQKLNFMVAKETLCGCTGDQYIPEPNLQIKADGSVERVRYNDQVLLFHGHCEIYLVKHEIGASLANVYADNGVSKVTLNVSLNGICEGTLRYKIKSPNFHEIWIHVSKGINRCTCLHFNETDDNFADFYNALSKIVSELKECKRSRTPAKHIYKLVAFKSCTKREYNTNAQVQTNEIKTRVSTMETGQQNTGEKDKRDTTTPKLSNTATEETQHVATTGQLSNDSKESETKKDIFSLSPFMTFRGNKGFCKEKSFDIDSLQLTDLNTETCHELRFPDDLGKVLSPQSLLRDCQCTVLRHTDKQNQYENNDRTTLPTLKTNLLSANCVGKEGRNFNETIFLTMRDRVPRDKVASDAKEKPNTVVNDIKSEDSESGVNNNLDETIYIPMGRIDDIE